MIPSVQLTFPNDCGIVNLKPIHDKITSPPHEKEDVTALLKAGVAKNSKEIMKGTAVAVAGIALLFFGVALLLGAVLLPAYVFPLLPLGFLVAFACMLGGTGCMAAGGWMVGIGECEVNPYENLEMQNGHFKDPRFAQILEKVKHSDRETEMFTERFHRFYERKIQWDNAHQSRAECEKEYDQKKAKWKKWNEANKQVSSGLVNAYKEAFRSHLKELQQSLQSHKQKVGKAQDKMEAFLMKNPDLIGIWCEIKKGVSDVSC